MKRILIIDDTSRDQEIATKILSSSGYQIVGVASDGEKGLVEYRRLNPDLTLIDVIMPGLNGIETLLEIRTINPLAKVILCTSVGHSTVIDLAMRVGANGYVVKPYDADILTTSVKRVLEVT
nr:response regulator [uncultured Methanospirillum sp.]